MTEIISAWPDRPRLGAQLMIGKYGAPQEATADQLVWHDQGAYKKINVTRAEHHHDFPKPHMDFMEHTINYRVPPERAAALAEYDGSCTFDRTRGELSARCDLEGHNILTLNLAHDIVTGKMTAQQARKAFSEIVTDDIKGKYPAYTTALQFDPEGSDVAEFADTSTIPGSPERPDGLTDTKGDKIDGEVLGFVGAADELEVVAAIAASGKNLKPEIAEFAQMLHEAHGKHLEATLLLGQRIGVTPLETPAVDSFRQKNAGQLADLATLDGDEFSDAFVEAKVKGHTELIEMLDKKLIQSANSADVKLHLSEMRTHLSSHLAQAEAMRSHPA
ncbi:MAG: DUF4142 domain-containing protein [Phycisphaerales bacterium]|nr:DUF4142 domain-containing protein [Hyphomonadaceae bacterium]